MEPPEPKAIYFNEDGSTRAGYRLKLRPDLERFMERGCPVALAPRHLQAEMYPGKPKR